MIDKAFLTQLTGNTKIWCMFSPVTRHPFLYLDPNTDENQIFLCSTEELLEDNAQAFLDLMYPVTKVGLSGPEKRRFFTDSRMLGVTEIVYISEEGKHILKLDEVLEHPELTLVSGWEKVMTRKKLMESDTILFNPQLQSTVLYFAQELNRDVSPAEKKAGISYFIAQFQEKLAHADFILPILGSRGQMIIPGRKLKEGEFGAVVLNDQAGNQWLPVFTDDMEFQMFNREKKMGTIKGRLSDLIKRLPESGRGVLLNANSVSMQLQMEVLKTVFEKYKD